MDEATARERERRYRERNSETMTEADTERLERK